MPTKIEWTDETWNPVTGCTKISAGCANCYAERMSKRLAGRFGYPADEPFRVTLHPDRLHQPDYWKKPRLVFVVSMGDLFHEDVPYEFCGRVWAHFDANPRHTFQVLTKRPETMWDVAHNIPCGTLPNVWLGVTTENQQCADERIPILLDTPAAVRFVSVEPMLGPVNISGWLVPPPPHWPDHDHPWLDWVIIGCESGPGRRPMELEWAVDLVRQCQAAGVPVFVKQIGVKGKVSHNPEEWPEELRVREYPE